ncbi:hypothetical protein LEM8419_00151 [Neolewinella maritima]|uniref:HTH LytTR-type domain-containing protein n=1 Tax=Neolewinella maritima TaxID=1383882 RepID=A0ABN8EYK6_9BACT|nr:LytTR family DNA-binding domain-containing protein [Neolewinella maritima]CAH0998836.1 hypothetical protein LEM8419_00151 [Neolewinella maritima]
MPLVSTPALPGAADWVAVLDSDRRAARRLRTKLRAYWPDCFRYRSFSTLSRFLGAARCHPPRLVFITTTLFGYPSGGLCTALPEGAPTVVLTSAVREPDVPPLRITDQCYLIAAGATQPVLHELVQQVGSELKPPGTEPIEQGTESPPHYLALVSQEGIRYVRASEIVYLRADSNYTTVHILGEETRVVCRSLREFDALLAPWGFLRVHQSYLINPAYVREYLRKDGGKILLAEGGEALLARSRRESFFRAMQDWCY